MQTDVHATHELSVSQQFILTGQHLQQGEPLYNMVLAYHVSGELDEEVFSRAFQALVDRCDALRTVLVKQGESGTYRQRIQQNVTYCLELVDLSRHKDGDAAAKKLMSRWSRKNFDLQHCLFESKLIRLSSKRCIWYFNQHHIITDAWSFSLIFSALNALYQAVRDGGVSEIGTLPSYAGYLQYERDIMASKQFERAREYWSTQRSELPTPSRFYRRTPPDLSGHTHRVPLELDAACTAQLDLCGQQVPFRAFTADLSRMQLMATVLFAYLYRVTGNHVLSIGTPSHSRSSQSLKETAGLLINIFPLRVTVEEGETFTTLYKKVSRANQELLIHGIPGSVDASQNRAFDVVLNYIPSSFGTFNDALVRSEWIHPGHGDRNHLLRLQVHNFDQADTLSLFFDLNVDVFVGQERDWVPAQFQLLLKALLADADTPISKPPLLPADAMPSYQIDCPWPARQEVAETVIDLFLERLRENPDAVALRCIEDSLSLSKLERQSAALAGYLLQSGLMAGDIVALCVPRSQAAVVAMLGILRAGCVLLPVDWNSPQERLAFILKDSQAAMFLSEEKYSCVPLGPDCRFVDLSVQWRTMLYTPPISLRTLSLESPAYVIYTSGSTGNPKGVEVTHSSFGNYIRWARDFYLGREKLDFALFSSLGFDLTLTSVFVPLVSGSTLHIYREPENPADITIRRVVEDNRAQVIKLTPAHLAMIQNMDFSNSRIRKLIVGGEDLKCELAATLTRYFGPSLEIYNEYGPTEATVACTVHRYTSSDDQRESVPIGRPITNASIHILDEHVNPVPQGVTGEIYIGGAGLANGYLNQPALSAERFLSGIANSERVYRSGDRGLWNEKGEIEYQGRLDTQVKLRGVRIELQEVEASLLQHPSVSNVAVELIEPTVTTAENTALEHCRLCGLASNHPSAQLDDSGICRPCRIYESQRQYANRYFRTLDDLDDLIRTVRAEAKGPQDCIMLLSGGKDSSYALCRLVDMGLKPLVFTLDNGYISEDAKANIQRLVSRLGLELVVGETPAMNAIFADSLARHSNVCNGCFKTIYTLSMKIARQRGIRTICTGLSRGQIFETRVAHLFQQGVFDPAEIDRQIIEARKAYHRADDVIARSLDVEVFQDDSIFEEIRYLDFYRYTEVTLEEVYAYLSTKAPWIRPRDTGRSTNCLINEVGIAVHKAERGYHNYSLPYSWDVRLGHKQRDAALAELDDQIDSDKVTRILHEVGYQPRVSSTDEVVDRYLAAYYVSTEELSEKALRQFLAARLPAEFLPRRFIHMNTLPLTVNGKVDRLLLPAPDQQRPELANQYVSPSNRMERALAAIWSRMLSIDDPGVNDNFFELGGDSIISIQIVSAAREEAIAITPQQMFDYPTIRSLAAVAGTVERVQAEQEAVVGEVPLLPGQAHFLKHCKGNPLSYCQRIVLWLTRPPDSAHLQSALNQLLCHHDALRASFKKDDDGVWRQEILTYREENVPLQQLHCEPGDLQRPERLCDDLTPGLMSALDLGKGKLFAAGLASAGDGSVALVVIAHHLAVDGVSWWVLVDDLERALAQLTAGEAVNLPPKTVSVRQWAQALQSWAENHGEEQELSFWQARSGSLIPATQIPTHQPGTERSKVDVILSEQITRQIIREVPAHYGVHAPELLLTALLRGLSRLRGETDFRVAIEGHGRETLSEGYNLDRTVGWLTSMHTQELRLSAENELSHCLKTVKEALRTVPNRGLGFGVLRYMSPSLRLRSQIEGYAPAEVLFNYMGQWGRDASEGRKLSILQPVDITNDSALGERFAVEVNALVFDQCLRVELDCQQSEESTLCAQLATLMRESVAELVHFCLESADQAYTPSDFPAADLDQSELDDILAELGDDEEDE